MSSRTRRLEVEEIGDVVVAQFSDKKLLDESNIQTVGEELFSLVEKRQWKEIIVDFSIVEYMSSAMLGKLISLDKRGKAAGVRVTFCGIHPVIYENFQITRLNKLFRIYLNVDTALGASHRLVASCPVSGCGGAGWNAVGESWPMQSTFRCANCSAAFTLRLGRLRRTDSDYTLAGLELPTYDGEKVRLQAWVAKPPEKGRPAPPKPGGRWRLSVEGRLDLFAAEIVEKAWRTLPSPRHVVIDLTCASELTDSAGDVLSEFGRGTAANDKAVFLVNADQRDPLIAIATGIPILVDPDQVEGELPPLPQKQQTTLPVSVRLE